MTKSYIVGGNINNLNTSTTAYYSSPVGDLAAWTTTASYAQGKTPVAGTIKSIRVKLAAAPGAGKSYTFTVMLSGSASALAVTISDSATTGYSATDVTVSTSTAYIAIRSVAAGTPTATTASWVIEFDSTTANQSNWASNSRTGMSSSTYGAMYGHSGSFSTTEADVQQVVPCAGTIDYLNVGLSGSPGTGTSYTFTVRVNGVDSGVTVTIADADTQEQDITNSVSVAAGDLVSLGIVESGAATGRYVYWGSRFTSTTAGDWAVMSYCLTDVPADEDVHTGHGYATWETSTVGGFLVDDCTLKSIYNYRVTAPGASTAIEVFVRDDGTSIDGATAIVSGTSNSGNRTNINKIIQVGSLVTLRYNTKTGSPTHSKGSVGLCFNSVLLVPLTEHVTLFDGKNNPRIFTSGFETNDFSEYTSTVETGTGDASTGTGYKYTGTYGAKFTGPASSSAYVTKTTSTYNVYTSFYLYIETMPSVTVEIYYAPCGYLTLIDTGYIRVYGVDNGDGVSPILTKQLSTGTWYHIETYSFIDAEDGKFEVWIDGVKQVQHMNMNTIDDLNDSIYMGTVWVTATSTNSPSIWIDDFVIDGSYVGPSTNTLTRFPVKDLNDKIGLVSPDSTCVFRLDCDEGNGLTAKDTAGNQTVTLSGATWGTGKQGTGLSFGGDGDYAMSSGAVSTPTAFTALAWFKRSGASGAGSGGSDTGHTIIYGINGYDGYANRVIVPSAGGQATVQINVGAGVQSEVKTYTEDGNFHLVGMVWDGTTFYAIADNTWSAGEAASGTLVSGSHGIVLGRNGDADVNYWANGIIDNVMIFNRALTSDEITEIYNQGESEYLSLVEDYLATYITKTGTDTSGTGNSLGITFSHTLVAGDNRLVVVCTATENAGTCDVTGITYGGVAMTKANDYLAGTSTYMNVEIWYILEDDLPADGSQSVVVTMSGTASGTEMNAYCSEYINVAQAAPEATDADGWQATSPLAITSTISPSDNAWVISAMGAGAIGSYSHGENQQELIDFSDASSQFCVAELRNANGETSLTSTFSGTLNRQARVAVSFALLSYEEFLETFYETLHLAPQNPLMLETFEGAQKVTGYASNIGSYTATDTTNPLSYPYNVKFTDPIQAAASYYNHAYYSLGSAKTTVYTMVGKLKFDQLPGSGDYFNILGIGHSTTLSGAGTCYAHLTYDGTDYHWGVWVFTGSSLTRYNGTGKTISANTDYKVELYCTQLNSATNVVRLWVDDVLELELTGINTYSATRLMQYCIWGQSWGAVDAETNFYYDDIACGDNRLGEESLLLTAVKDLNDTVTQTDSITKVRTILRQTLETITITGKDTEINSVLKEVTKQTLTLSDTEINAITKKPLTEAATLTETMLKDVTWLRTMTDAISVGNLLLLDSDRVRTMVEQLQLTDTYTDIGVVYRTLRDKLGLVAPDTSNILRMNFEEGQGLTTKDTSSGNSHTGTLNEYASWTTGKYGNALEFVGDLGGGSLSLDNPTTLYPGDNSLTVAGWFYHTSYVYPRSVMCIGAEHNTSNIEWMCGHGHNDNGIILRWADGTNIINSTLTFDVGSRPADFQNTWVHLVIVFDRSAGVAKGYVNGVKQFVELDISSVTGTISETGPMVISGCWGWRLGGKADDINIFNRALNSDEVANLYSQGETRYIDKDIIHRPITETSTLTDTEINTLSKKPFSETITITAKDTEINAISRTINNAITLTGTMLKDWTKLRQLTESITLTGTILKDWTKLRQLTESITLTGTMLKDVTWLRTRTETSTLSDSEINYPRKVISNSATLSDSEINYPIRTISNSITLSDTEINKPLKSISNTITLVDTMLKDVAWIRTITNAITLGNLLLIDSDRVRTITEQLHLTDTKLEELDWFRIKTETATLADTMLKDITWMRQMVETISETDSIIQDTRKVLSENIELILGELILDYTAGWDLFIETLGETVTLTDSMIRATTSIINQVLTLSDVLTKIESLLEIYTESITLSDNEINKTLRTVSNSISLSDTEINYPRKSISNNLSLTDIEINSISRSISNTITLIDTVLRRSTLYEIRTELITLNASLLLDSDRMRTMTEQLHLTDTYIDLRGIIYRIRTESISLADTEINYTRKTINNSISLTDNEISAINTISSENITLSSSLTKIGSYRKQFTDTLSLVDTRLVIAGYSKSLLEATTLIDDIDKFTSIIIRDDVHLGDSPPTDWIEVDQDVSEIIYLTDTLEYVKGLILDAFVEIITLTDTATADLAFIRTLLETATLVGTLVKRLTLPRIWTETVILTDNEINSISTTKTENIDISDLINRIITPGYFMESITLVDTITKILPKLWIEAITLTDNETNRISTTKIENIDISDIIRRNIIPDYFTESLALTDTRRLLAALDKNETLALSENSIFAINRTISNNIQLLDTLMLDMDRLRMMSETIHLTDTISRYLTMYRTFNETITLIQVYFEAFIAQFVNLTESITLTDSNIFKITKTFSEGASLDDTLIKVSLLTKSFLESIAIVDNETMDVALSFEDMLTLTDSIYNIIGYNLLLEDELSLTDILSFTNILSVEMLEAISLTDTLVRIMYLDFLEGITLTETFTKYAVFKIVESITTLGLMNKRLILDLFSKNSELSLMNKNVKIDMMTKKQVIDLLNKRIIIGRDQ